MDIRGYLQTSLIEWPGEIASVVWVAGCNFRCPFCQNKDLVLAPEKLPLISPQEILHDLEKRKAFIDGVVVSGGEPTLQKNLAWFLKEIKNLGFLTMIETNASQPAVLKNLLDENLLDRLSIDIKSPFEAYPRTVRALVLVEAIKNSLRLALGAGVDLELRTTVVPTLHNQESLIKLGQQLQEFKADLSWALQQFVPQNCLNPEFEKIKPYSRKKMKAILTGVQKHVPGAKLRGV